MRPLPSLLISIVLDQVLSQLAFNTTDEVFTKALILDHFFHIAKLTFMVRTNTKLYIVSAQDYFPWR